MTSLRAEFLSTVIFSKRYEATRAGASALSCKWKIMTLLQGSSPFSNLVDPFVSNQSPKKCAFGCKWKCPTMSHCLFFWGSGGACLLSHNSSRRAVSWKRSRTLISPRTWGSWKFLRYEKLVTPSSEWCIKCRCCAGRAETQLKSDAFTLCYTFRGEKRRKSAHSNASQTNTN